MSLYIFLKNYYVFAQKINRVNFITLACFSIQIVIKEFNEGYESFLLKNGHIPNFDKNLSPIFWSHHFKK